MWKKQTKISTFFFRFRPFSCTKSSKKTISWHFLEKKSSEVILLAIRFVSEMLTKYPYVAWFARCYVRLKNRNYFFKFSQIDFSTIGNQSLIDFYRVRASRQKLKSQKRGFEPKWSPAKKFKNRRSLQDMGADFRSNEGSIII